MKAQRDIPFIDTNIIPARNAGIGSLLWDLQNSQDPDWEGASLLGPEFAFIDVGVSRARVSTTLKTLLARDLRMEVEYVATECPDAMPYANVTPVEDRAAEIREYLSGMISSKETMREVNDWYYVVDRDGKVSSITYSYKLHGNEVWEAYFMGRPFMVSGEKVEFIDPTLDKIVAYDVKNIEAKIDLEKIWESDPSQPATSWDGYRIEKNPLEAGLAEFGITLQKTDIPQRINGKQNVLFLGNVLNHYPQGEKTREFDRIVENMKDGDIIIVQVDELDECSIEVFKVKDDGPQKTLERVRWINTKKLEIQKLVYGQGTWRQIRLKPGLKLIVMRLTDCLDRRVISPQWNQNDHKVLVHQNISYVFTSFFRAVPVEETIRIAIREALQRLPSESGPKEMPVFDGDLTDVYGGALQLDLSPIVSKEDLFYMKLAAANAERTLADDA